MFPIPTQEEVAATPWEEVLATASEPTCGAYATALFQRAREAEERGYQREVGVYALLGTVASFRRVELNNNTTFDPAVVQHTWRGLGGGDLSEAQLDLLGTLTVQDPEMRARICDLLWTHRRGYRFAETAVDAYIASATRLEHLDLGFELVDRIERAIQLGCTIGGAPRQRAIDLLLSTLNSFRAREAEKTTFIGVKLLGVVQSLNEGDAATWAQHAEHYAGASESAASWPMAREYWQLAAKFHARGKAETERKAAAVRAAETYVREADAAADRRVGAHFLAGAVEAYRRIGGERKRAAELHATMLRWQRESVGKFQTVSESVDVSDLVARARSAVRGKPLTDALFSLVRLTRFRPVSELRKDVEDSSKRFLHLSLFPTTVIDAKGKAIAHRAALRGSAAPEDDDAVSCQMHSNAAFERRFSAQATIEPARAEILSEHAPTIQDFLALVENNPFVPTGREYAFAKGLHAGLFGDFFQSTHVLIPQFENSIRELLWRRKVITSTLLPDGTQEDRDINSLLYGDEVKAIFGEDLLFHLRGILIHRFGSNLRNNMAHGLLDDSAYFSPEAVYLWWLTLHIVCFPLLRVQATTEPEESDEQDPSTGEAKERASES